jgi:GLPGLI family protein
LIFLFVFLSVVSCKLNAQNIKVTYDYKSFGGHLKYEPTLLVTEQNSQFYVNYDDETKEYKGSTLEFTGRNYVLNYEFATKEFTELRYLENFEVKASWINKQDWEILDETKTILGYSVRKAKIRKNGKIMFAWFTTDIPLKTGPFDNGGLPGLILEFYFSSINTTCVAINIEFDTDEKLKEFTSAFEISKEELENLDENRKDIKKRINNNN